MKVYEAVNLAKERLTAFENPVLEAEWLVALTLGIKRNEVYSKFELSEIQFKALEENLKKREQGVPLQYIIGTAEFYGLTINVNENVLIPRPETEELVELAKDFIKSSNKILDIGTGSGAIAIAIKKLTDANVTAIDVSKEAIEIAQKNAKINHFDVKFAVSDLFSEVKGEKFDVIISNPPYISEDEWRKLDAGVKDYEPKLALVGGDDGLEFYRRIITEAPKHLNKNGKIFFEIGYNQAENVAKMLEKDFIEIKVKKDLEGQDRIVYASLK